MLSCSILSLQLILFAEQGVSCGFFSQAGGDGMQTTKWKSLSAVPLVWQDCIIMQMLSHTLPLLKVVLQKNEVYYIHKISTTWVHNVKVVLQVVCNLLPHSCLKSLYWVQVDSLSLFITVPSICKHVKERDTTLNPKCPFLSLLPLVFRSDSQSLHQDLQGGLQNSWISGSHFGFRGMVWWKN